MSPNTIKMIEARNLILKKKMEKQFKKLSFAPLKKQMKILEVYIFDDNRYIYHVLNKLEEEFYILNEDRLCKMSIEKRKYSAKIKKIEYACGLGKSGFIHFKIFFDEEDTELTYMKMENKTLYNKLDSYLHNMFHDIYRMENS